MSTLFELAGNYKAFENDLPSLIEQVELGLIPEEAITDTIDGLDGELDQKVDSIICIIKNLNSDIDAIEKEIESLEDRAVKKMKEVERLKKYLGTSLQYADLKKKETIHGVVSIRQSESLKVNKEDQENLIDWLKQNNKSELVRTKTTVTEELNKDLIKSALKIGEPIPFVSIEVKTNTTIK